MSLFTGRHFDDFYTLIPPPPPPPHRSIRSRPDVVSVNLETINKRQGPGRDRMVIQPFVLSYFLLEKSKWLPNRVIWALFQERQKTKNHCDQEGSHLKTSVRHLGYSRLRDLEPGRVVVVTSSFSDSIVLAFHSRKTAFSKSIVFKSLHSGKRFWNDLFSLIVFGVVVWTVAVSGTTVSVVWTQCSVDGVLDGISSKTIIVKSDRLKIIPHVEKLCLICKDFIQV